MNILIYALGGGWGHLTRAAALARALGPVEVRILANSPYCGIVQAAMPDLAIDAVSTREEAAAVIESSAADILVVDTFPRGLGGELTALLPSCRAEKKILIHRDLSPEYIAWAKGIREFVAAQFDCIFCPGESGPFSDLAQAKETSGWIVREPVALDSVAPSVVICAGGNADELRWYGDVAAQLLARGVDVQCLAAEPPPGCARERWLRAWPAIDWIAAARVAVGGAGYNTVNECLATGTPLIAKPWPRKYDRQRERAERSPGVTIVETPTEATNAVYKILAQPPAPRRSVFHNGSIEAAKWIHKR